jgi:hypothetical protein
LLAGAEHLGRPARAAQHGRRAHLAAVRLHGAIGADHVEVDPAMRVDEIDAGDRARELDVLVAIERAGAVVRPYRGAQERGSGQGQRSIHGGSIGPLAGQIAPERPAR